MSTHIPPVVPSRSLSPTRCHALPRRPRPVGTSQTPTGLNPARLRARCRLALPPRVWTELTDLAGPIIEWWVDRTPSSVTGLPHAAVLGQRGLAVADPVGFDPGAPAYVITHHRLSEAVEQDVTHRPGPGSTPDPTRYVPFIGLDPAHRALLGQLPIQVQLLLQRPFVGGLVQRCDWHYEGVGDNYRMFMVHLADAERVTVAYGARTVPLGHTTDTAHWSLRVFVAAVAEQETVMLYSP